MLQEETLRQQENSRYEEPEGTFLEVLSDNTHSITVLTRIKAGSAELPDPGELSVSDLTDVLQENEYTADHAARLIESEEEGQDRKTAIDAIETYATE